MAMPSSMTLRPRTGLVSARPSVSARRAAPRVVSVKALGDTQLVISGTGACLVGLCWPRPCLLTHHCPCTTAGTSAEELALLCFACPDQDLQLVSELQSCQSTDRQKN